MNKHLFKKPSLFSGFSGHFYATKLTSLIVFRALHDDDIEELIIGTDIDGIGNFDDVCIRFKAKGIEKPVAVFVQVKYANDQDTAHALSATDLARSFESYLKIRNKFNINNKDALFGASYKDVECAFVIYTNRRDVINKKRGENKVISKLNDIMSTGDGVFQILKDGGHDELLHTLLQTDIKNLASLLGRIVRKRHWQELLLMSNQLLQTYHVILARHVLRITDSESEEHNLGCFREEFFDTNDKNLSLLKDNIYAGIIKDNKPNEKEVSILLSELFSEPSEVVISKLIGGVIEYKNNQLEFVDTGLSADLKLVKQLEKVNPTAEVVSRAIEIRGRSMLQSVIFMLHKGFGNRDLTIRGNERKVKRRLDYISKIFVQLLVKAKERYINDEKYKIVEIDDSVKEKVFVALNGGIGGTVGNLLVMDETTKLLTFANRDDLKDQPLALSLFDIIISKIADGEMKEYRFDVKLEHFPKLSFGCNAHLKGFVDDFMHKVLCYTKQAGLQEVENILKGEIAELLNIREQCNFQIKTEAIYLKFYDNIVQWSMMERVGVYLTKESDIFKTTTEYIWTPLLTITDVFNKDKFIKNYLKYKPEVVNLLSGWRFDKFGQSQVTVIVSELIDLSVVKVVQQFEDTTYSLIDLNYILNLSANDYSQLIIEISSREENIFVLLWNCRLQGRNINDFFNTFEDKKLVVVTASETVQEIKTCAAYRINMVVDEASSLVDLTETSQKVILNRTVIFQDALVKLRNLLDDDAKVLIKGENLNTLITGESYIQIGETLTNSVYEAMKESYVNRKAVNELLRSKSTTHRPIDSVPILGHSSATVHYQQREKESPRRLYSLNSISDHAVLITAEPGMGKSCLLTHLSLNTRTYDSKAWIVRINLLDYSRCFYQWKKNNVVIGILEALRFICIHVGNQKENGFENSETIILNGNEREICLNDSTKLNGSVAFELSMFLYFCNRRQVVFLFDGFDEICPHYAEEVLALIKILKSYHPGQHRLWVATRTYNGVHDTLEREFGSSYRLMPLDRNARYEMYRNVQYKLPYNFGEEVVHNSRNMQSFIERSIKTKIFGPAIGWWKKLLPDESSRRRARRHLFGVHHKLRSWIREKLRENRYDIFSTPLHMLMLVDYLDNAIVRTDEEVQWDKIFATKPIHEHFMDTILRKIYFEGKCKMDTDMPAVKLVYKRTRQQLTNKYKKLAAYATFNRYADKLFNENEMKSIMDDINSIKLGEDKTGIVCDVVNDVPRFLDDYIFRDYFAVEHICDLLNAESSDAVPLWDLLLNSVFFEAKPNVLCVIDEKLGADDKFFTVANYEANLRIILDLLMKQKPDQSSLHVAMRPDMFNWMTLFISSFDYLNSKTLRQFINMIVNNALLRRSIVTQKREFIGAVLNVVRHIDVSQMSTLFGNVPGPVDWSGTNENIIEAIRSAYDVSTLHSESSSDFDTDSDSDVDTDLEYRHMKFIRSFKRLD